jgi:CDP-diacylglycerol--serine O-phosphatidyltransferase
MWSLPNNELLLFSSGDAPGWVLPILVLVISAASAWRLAKFNIDTRQSTKFIGLATPANALFWASLPLTIASNAVWGPGSLYLRKWLTLHLAMQPIVALVLALVLGALMLSELPLPSLKFTHKGWKGNEVIFLLVGIGVLLAVLYGILAVPLILVIYLLSPLWGKAFKKDRSNRNEATAQRERNVDL